MPAHSCQALQWMTRHICEQINAHSFGHSSGLHDRRNIKCAGCTDLPRCGKSLTKHACAASPVPIAWRILWSLPVDPAAEAARRRLLRRRLRGLLSLLRQLRSGAHPGVVVPVVRVEVRQQLRSCRSRIKCVRRRSL